EWNAIDNTNEDPSRQGPYVYSIEEPQLRRRWLFPPAEMSISGLHGNPALPNEGLGSGGGDFSNRLFPQQSPYFGGQSETVHDGNHQYWPFDIYNGGVVRFVEQMNPYNVDQYNHRHVVTTASHDDLLSRGSTIDYLQAQSCGSGGGTFRAWERRDILDLMKERVLTDQCSGDDDGFGFEELNFEYVNYPHTILSATRTADYGEPSSSGTDDLTGLFYLGGAVSWCECEDPLNNYEPTCSADLRKGRLALSLPWLDQATVDEEDSDNWSTGTPYSGLLLRTLDQPLSVSARNNLIQEAFMMLLLNARANNNAWGRFVNENDCNSVPGPDRGWVRTREQWENIERAAASLTANMIDFMDRDDVPTRIAVRNFEFPNTRDPFDSAPPRVTPVGRPLDEDGNGIPDEYVYGLEKQPYITEVAAYLTFEEGDPPSGDIDTTKSGYAVELFNPYDTPIVPQSQFDLPQFDLQFPNGDVITLQETIPARGYLVVYSDPQGQFDTGNGPFSRFQDETGNFSFQNEETVKLTLSVPYRRDDYSVESQRSFMVLDEFKVGGNPAGGFIAPAVGAGETADTSWSVHERRSVARQYASPSPSNTAGPWYAVHPERAEDADGNISGPNDLTLGADAATFAPSNRVPVEVFVANTGSFASAFPTTGTMLLLMRHANGDFNIAGESFTRSLEFSENEIDNGRLPIFDTALANHWNPAADEDGMTAWTEYRPGETMHLPWGQLVFDYFTALPLSSIGPYRAVGNPDNLVDERDQARVDEGGLRVHGRININAAPWSVMRGLPFVPMVNYARHDNASGSSRLQQMLRLYLSPPGDDQGPVDLNGDTVDDFRSGVLGIERAHSIVAYREFADIDVNSTGNYGCNPGGGGGACSDTRNWETNAPTMRRGTGFLSVGELANVRHRDADHAYRMDAGQVGSFGASGSLPESRFLKAAASLICLGDWMTVRSHVYTVYGSIRGEFIEPVEGEVTPERLQLDSIDDRAIRFQETIDRLPMFMGAARPSTVGQGVTGKYTDVISD
ncbi:MAG: hypothetical protein ACYTHJ_15855, partial [Planctomycetota bacterium]